MTVRRCSAWRAAGMIALLAALYGPTVALAAVDGPTLQLREPRAYGWFVGDVLERTLLVDAPAGSVVDDASLPSGTRHGQPVELRRRELRSRSEGGREHIELRLQYQVFAAPAEVRTLEVAPFVLKLRQGSTLHELRVEAMPVTVAPLVPQEVSPRNGLGELQPDAPPPPPRERGLRRGLLAFGLLALPALVYLAWAWALAPWLGARRRPFHAAWRQLRQVPDGADGLQRQQAWQALHQALNTSAGQVLFERDLPAFLALRPGFAALQADLQRFFQASRSAFFGSGPGEADLAWLKALCRRCRDAERGL